MYEVTVIFLALMHVANGGDTVPVGQAQGVTKFPTEEACKAAGEIIYGSLAAQVDHVLRTTGQGVLQGAKIVCKSDREAI